MSKKFIRTDAKRFSKLGRGRKKLLKWRRAVGIHSKIRKYRFGYPARPQVGYKTAKSQAGLIKGKEPILVHNEKELMNAKKENIVIIARVGAKKRMELIKKAEEMKLHILNVKGGQNATR